ncbi:MAG TPA: type II toxin-antitoxin system PemK/MazF family toxin [Croceibacterium sp.]|nr:type II toxin-antitoxin system PemK/MazF family toxin [Croceibacterium sp.]
MPIQQHPEQGGIVMCDYSLGGFNEPEMVKNRPVLVLTPRIINRPFLCTVVGLSASAPDPQMPYHRQIRIRPPLAKYWSSDDVWVKGDMVNAVGFHRLDLIRLGKDRAGKRIYHLDAIEPDQFKIVRECVLRAMGLSILTKHLV